MVDGELVDDVAEVVLGGLLLLILLLVIQALVVLTDPDRIQ